MKLLKYSLLFVLFLLIVIGAGSFVLENVALRETRSFDAIKFQELEFTMEELTLFCDVVFTSENTRVRKWTTDIKVEIKNKADLDEKYIAEVDSIIAIFAPLIAPLKIERVEGDGNLHVYRKVTCISGPRNGKRWYLNGLARINKRTTYSWDINFACVYDSYNGTSQTLIHEFQHALGLDHPINLYPFYVTIGRSVIPQYFKSKEETQAYLNEPFYLSNQEKKVITMLYSSEVKPGLHIDLFTQRMGLSKSDVQRMLPNKNKPKSVIIYPVDKK
ncbi:MAG: hypothetical protein E6767_02120 [Dysgonomonas sp.]|nr:hypothetical protein [Dysgonomonas sp.]